MTNLSLCRDCGRLQPESSMRATRCGGCGGPRLLRHAELPSLAIAHIDADAFYATVEKRDNPALRDRPVIVGGGRRGVVAAACYIARLYGVRSAMPMFKALDACPDAVVVRPNMSKYQAVGREVREAMLALTPLVEPLSIDEAFLDLSPVADAGTLPATALVHLVNEVEARIGVTLSIGLSYNKFLAKIASDLDKPRGFAVIGRSDAAAFLADQPVRIIFGVGEHLAKKLAGDGIRTIGQLAALDETWLIRRYGKMGRRLYRFARGEDHRAVQPEHDTKSISNETTFASDVADPDQLAGRLWPLAEKVADRANAKGFRGRTVTVKAKTADFRILTRSATGPPIASAEALFAVAKPLLDGLADGTAYRLIGVGISHLEEVFEAPTDDLLRYEPVHRAPPPASDPPPTPPKRQVWRRRLL